MRKLSELCKEFGVSYSYSRKMAREKKFDAIKKKIRLNMLGSSRMVDVWFAEEEAFVSYLRSRNL